jgi:hypothetical protein
MSTKQRPYGFVTTTGFIIEGKGSTTKQAHSRAVAHLKRIKTNIPKGEVTKHYQTYGKSGFAPTGMFRTLGAKLR